MVGFFTSGVLASLAPGLATFINKSQGSFRLVISPILNADDWAAIEAGVSDVEEVIQSVFDNVLVTEDAIERHTLECLSWLLRQGRMEIQIALSEERDCFIRRSGYLMTDQEQVLCAHGSTNLTSCGDAPQCRTSSGLHLLG